MKVTSRIALILFLLFFSLVIYWAITPNSSPSWTGFGGYNQTPNFVREKTLWDWLDLLVIPLFLAISASILSSIQKQSDKITEEDRQKQIVLSTYFEKISTLLLEQKLRTSKNSSEARILARTQSLFAFRNLDGDRKAKALQFIYEAGLIYSPPIVNLNGANLSKANLQYATLQRSELKGVFLRNAILKGANLANTNLCGSNLENSDFEGAIVTGADFSYTNLSHANLRSLDLTSTNIDWVILDYADLTDAKLLPEQLKNIASSKNTKFPK